MSDETRRAAGALQSDLMVQTEIPVSVQFQMLRTVEPAHLGDLAKTSALLLADDYPLMLK